jgi:hypothetical protein
LSAGSYEGVTQTESAAGLPQVAAPRFVSLLARAGNGVDAHSSFPVFASNAAMKPRMPYRRRRADEDLVPHPSGAMVIE